MQPFDDTGHLYVQHLQAQIQLLEEKVEEQQVALDAKDATIDRLLVELRVCDAEH